MIDARPAKRMQARYPKRKTHNRLTRRPAPRFPKYSFDKTPQTQRIQAQPLRDGNSECVRPAHLERSSTVRLPDYLRWHGAAQLGTPRAKLAQIAYGLLPRDVFISVEQRAPGNLDPDEWAILRRVIDLIKTNANGAELGPVLETIENALRADTRRLALPRLVTWLIVGGARRETCGLNSRPVVS